MNLLRFIPVALVAGTALVLPASQAAAQECVGSPPRGGKWVSSGELYINRARNPRSASDRRTRYQEAAEVLEEGFAAQPDNPRNYALAGEAYVGLLEFEKAAGVWDKALELWSCYEAELDTLRYRAWVDAFNLGVRYQSQDDREKARQYFEAAFIVYNKLPQPVITLAGYDAEESQAAAAAGDVEAADALRESAIANYRKAIGTLGAERLSDASRQQYTQAAYFNVAQLLAFDERFAEAGEAYEDFLELEPENATAMANAAVVLTRASEQLRDEADMVEDEAAKAELEAKAQGFQDRAEAYYQALLARDDLTADDYENIGIGLAQMNQYAPAAIAYTLALDLEPYRPGTLSQLAYALYQTDQYDSLIVVGKMLIERYPYDMNSLALLANGYRELEQPENALEILTLREEMKLELIRLRFEQEEGVAVITGGLSNIGLAEGTEITVVFELKDAEGETVGTVEETYALPPEGASAAIRIQSEVENPIAGFTYSLTIPEGAASGTQ